MESKRIARGAEKRRSGGIAKRIPTFGVDRPNTLAIASSALFHTSPKCYISVMTTEDIEKAVEQLAPRELARFRAWFEAFDAAQFDAAIERDACAGKLDAQAEEALAAHRAGQSRDL
jgi:hypothetical protein